MNIVEKIFSELDSIIDETQYGVIISKYQYRKIKDKYITESLKNIPLKEVKKDDKS